MASEKRKLELTIESSVGTFNIFHVWLNGYSVVMTDGKKGTWKGIIPSKGNVELEVVAYGLGDSSFVIVVDLEDNKEDQKHELKLQGGYREFKVIF